MDRGPDEVRDQEIVEQLLFDNCTKLRLVRFSRSEVHSSKSPDFKVLYEGELAAYCELSLPETIVWTKVFNMHHRVPLLVMPRQTRLIIESRGT